MYEADNGIWRIQAICVSGHYDILTFSADKQECQHTFNRLCDKIATCRLHDIIDMEDLWD